MTTVAEMRTYPRQVTLVRTGVRVIIRPLTAEDANEPLEFFLRVSEDDRFYLKENVTSPGVIGSWVHNIDHLRVFALVAVVNGRIVADGTLHRHRTGARRHIGEIRIVVEPEFRNHELGSLIVRELNDLAYDIGQERVIFELVEGIEEEAIKVAERLGFAKAGSLDNFVKDMDGRPHNLRIMDLPLDIWPDWWAF